MNKIETGKNFEGGLDKKKRRGRKEREREKEGKKEKNRRKGKKEKKGRKKWEKGVRVLKGGKYHKCVSLFMNIGNPPTFQRGVGGGEFGGWP